MSTYILSKWKGRDTAVVGGVEGTRQLSYCLTRELILKLRMKMVVNCKLG
jgi:hypothetical protein